MSVDAGFLGLVRRQGALLVARVLSRDSLHLGPSLTSPAAARRLKAGLRALEAYLRRVLILLALQLEPGLPRDTRPRTIYARAPRKPAERPHFRLLTAQRDFTPFTASDANSTQSIPQKSAILAAPYLTRLRTLKSLLDAPTARARRLAFHLARRRPGPILAPDAVGTNLPRRYGTEVSAIYAGLAQAILNASRTRPPPLGPMPREGPRIRLL